MLFRDNMAVCVTLDVSYILTGNLLVIHIVQTDASKKKFFTLIFNN